MLKLLSVQGTCILLHIYSVIIGGGVSSGIILQRFPEKDWSDTPFIEGIEWVSVSSSQRNIHRNCRFIHYECRTVVLSAARMGLVDGETRTSLLCLHTDGYRRESPLLRLHVLQRNCIDRAKQTSRRGGGSRRWR